MNKKQWIVFTIFSYLLAMLFVKISMQWKGYCNLDELLMSNIFSCIRGEIFAPYPYIFFTLGIIFMICASLESKK